MLMSDIAQKKNHSTLYYLLGGFFAAVLLLLLYLSGGLNAPASDEIRIRMSGSISDDLPWDFHPSKSIFNFKIGEQVKIFYTATNVSSQDTKGIAEFRVTPPEIAIYVSKLECFCFREQNLEPGQSAELPVVFFIDPEIRNDPDTKNLNSVNFHYTFHYYKAGDS